MRKSTLVLSSIVLLALAPEAGHAVVADPEDRGKAADDFVAGLVSGSQLISDEVAVDPLLVLEAAIADLEAQLANTELIIESRRRWLDPTRPRDPFGVPNHYLDPQPDVLDVLIAYLVGGDPLGTAMRDLKDRPEHLQDELDRALERRDELNKQLDVLRRNHDSIRTERRLPREPDPLPEIIQFSAANHWADASYVLPHLNAALGGTHVSDGGYAFSVTAEATHFDLEGPIGRDGDIQALTVWVSKGLGAGTKASLFARIRQGNIDSRRLNSGLDQDEAAVGGKLAMAVGSQETLSLAALWSWADNNINLDTATASFDTNMLGFAGRFESRRAQAYPWVITPFLAGEWVRLERDGFTDTASVTVPASTVYHGALDAGFRVAKMHVYTDSEILMFTPYAELSGRWRFDGADDRVLVASGGLVLDNAELHADVAFGAHVLWRSGFAVDGRVSYRGIGSDFEAVSGTLALAFAGGGRLEAHAGFAPGTANGYAAFAIAELAGRPAPAVRGYMTGLRLHLPL